MTTTLTLDPYSPLTDSLMFGLKDLSPESFRPCKGNILVTLLPEVKETEGGLTLPQTLRDRPTLARVAAVPEDESCPVVPGDWVLFRQNAERVVPFGNRKDLALLEYSDDVGSSILGVIHMEEIP